MKKGIIIGLIILLILGACVLTGVFLFKSGKITITETPEAPVVFIHKSDEGLTYTEDVWEWIPDIVNKKITYLPDTSNVQTSKQFLHLYDDFYMRFSVKDVGIKNDNLKTIYGRDGSFIIQVLDGIKKENVKSTLGIDDCFWEDDVLLTRTTKNGAQYIIKCIDDVAVVAKIYKDDEVYSTILNSYRDERNVIEQTFVNQSEDFLFIEKLPEQHTYLPTAEYEYDDLIPCKFSYADGSLDIHNDLNSIELILDTYKKRLNILTSSKLTSAYHKRDKFYVESEEYTIGLIERSSNSTIVMFGVGEEARANILHLLSSY